MLNVKEAAARAKEHAVEIFGDDKIADVMLEEVDFDSSPPTWKVTVSFVRPEQELRTLSTPRFMRTFKIVHLNADTGGLLKITHRTGGIAA